MQERGVDRRVRPRPSGDARPADHGAARSPTSWRTARSAASRSWTPNAYAGTDSTMDTMARNTTRPMAPSVGRWLASRRTAVAGASGLRPGSAPGSCAEDDRRQRGGRSQGTELGRRDEHLGIRAGRSDERVKRAATANADGSPERMDDRRVARVGARAGPPRRSRNPSRGR